MIEEMELLAEMISQLLLQYRGQRLTATDDLVLRYLEFIQVELSSIVASLSQMNSLPELREEYTDTMFLCWLEESKEVVRSMEISLDRSNQAGSHCFSRSARLPNREELELALRSFVPVCESFDRYKRVLQDDDGDCTSRMSSSAAQLHPYAVDTAENVFLVGIEATLRNKQFKWFMAEGEADKETLKVMSMVGPAGVGKTTLAMEVYHQLRQIRGGRHFQCYVTAKVSRKPDMNELLKHILSQIDESSTEQSQIITLEDEPDLQAGEINRHLQDKRYLIVIDDLRENPDWDIIKKAFPQNSPGSRIMVTTQLRSVAQLCSSHYTDGLLHEVKPLSQLDSKSLLLNDNFGSKDGYDEILKRCEGIPLFISGISDYLREKVQQNYPSDGMKIIPKAPRQIEQSLATIYDDLSYNSKASLMYMSIFAEGHTFYRDSLFWKWVMGGLTGDAYSQVGAEAERNRCLSEFIDKNVITRVAATNAQYPSQEENYHWQVNHFMQQFLASKSADKGLFFTGDTLTSLVARGGKKLGRGLSLHQPDPELPTLLEKIDLSNTRSLVISGEVDRIPLDKFTYLVVLDLEGWQRLQDENMLRICKMFLLQHLSLRNTTGVTKLPPGIKELQLLQTLDISYTRICELPSQVCELEWLRTLNLRSTPTRKLPEQFWKLQRLETLLVGGDGINYEIATEIPEEIKRPRNIGILATVDLSGCSASYVQALGVMEQLQVLAITWSFHQCNDKIFQEALCSALDKFHVLQSLTIHCGFGCCMDFLDSQSLQLDNLKKFKVANGRFSRLPQWVAGLSYLISIEITVCSLEPKDVRILGNLPKLEYLVIGLHFIPEAAIVIDGVGFDQLKRLSVCCRIPWLTFNEGAMEKLVFLELKIAGSPASEESVPSGISNLLSLTEVSIQYNEWYTNSLSVKRTVVAVRQGVAQHRMPVNLFINGIEDEQEDVEAFEVARASTSQNEIEAEE